MKNRKTAMIAFLLVAALMISVGYAALSDTLTIIGNAHIDIAAAENTFDSKIYFSASEVAAGTGGTGSLTPDVASHTSDDATFTANTLAVKDDSVQFKFTIKNDSNVSAKITINAKKLSGVDNPSNSNTSKFSVTYEYSRDDMTIPSGQTMDVIVTVAVINPITSATSATFGIELTATSVE